MSETTYLPEVRCEISEGLTESDVTVCVRDVEGSDQFIHVLPSMVNWFSGTPYLPVGVINIDYRNRRVLIELPIEADSGTNRMWMPIESFRVESGATAEEAIDRLAEQIQTRLDAGAKLAELSVATDSAPWKQDAGYLRDNPLYQPWREAMEEYRRQLDASIPVAAEPR